MPVRPLIVSPRSSYRRRSAMTLTETLLAAAGIGLLMLIVAVGIDQVRSDLKRRQVERVLLLLDRALDAYHQDTGAWPVASPVEAAEDSPSAEHPPTVLAAVDVLAALRSVEASRAIVDEIPAMLRRPLAPPPAASVIPPASQPADDAFAMLVDAWSRPLHCLTQHSRSTIQREAVAANGGRPIYISAGSDGLFESDDGSASGDNIRGDEVMQGGTPQ